MTPDEFRTHGHRLIDLIADYRATVATRPVMAPTEPGAIRALFHIEPPGAGEPFGRVIEDLERLVMPGL